MHLLIRGSENHLAITTMSSPAHSISSDEEETKRLAKIKARHDAKLREAAEHKAQKDQERREKKEREEKEAREAQELVETTCRLRDVYSAAAGKARERAEAEAQAKNERIPMHVMHLPFGADLLQLPTLLVGSGFASD